MRNKAIVVLFFGLIFLIFFPGRSDGVVPEVQRNALISLYNSTNGDNWDDNSGWKTNGEFSPPGTEGNWHGITVSGDHVSEIDLSNNNLAGAIPVELGDLSNLIHLNLSFNQLGGNITPELGNLLYLESINLSSNQLVGSLPPELGNLSSLIVLDFHSNLLTGNIPSEMGNMSNLIDLYLNGNRLSGSIPSSFGNLASLERLYLSDNKLSGTIPSQLGNLSILQELKIQSNALKGDLPEELGNLGTLSAGGSDIKWNGLYTDNETLKEFFDDKQEGGDWESFQTIAPGEVAARAMDSASIEVNWSPIAYSADPGSYHVLYSTTSGEPYEFSKATENKTVSRLKITGLTKDTEYFFVVRTQTDDHANNQNTIESDVSTEVSEMTPDLVTISGTVRTEASDGVPDVTISFSNNGGITSTDGDGHYSHSVARGWTGSAYPSKTGYTFSPDYRTYNDVQDNQSNRDYTAKRDFRYISGRITTQEGRSIPGVNLSFSNGGGTVKTNANGQYSHAVNYGWSGDVTPSKTGFEFDPAFNEYPGLTADIPGEDYIAYAVSPVVAGRVTSGNEGVPGVELTFSNNGGKIETDFEGHYFHAVAAGWYGKVTPSKYGYDFDPSSRDYAEVYEDQLDQDYDAGGVFPEISGKVTDPDGHGVFDVTLTFSNNGGTAATGSDGSYSHPVDYGWSGTVTPSKEGYRFNPLRRPYDNIYSDEHGGDYTAAAILPIISGRVTTAIGLKGLSGVTMDFISDSGATASVKTDGGGNYSHAVGEGWSGIVIPSKEGYSFSPPVSPHYPEVRDDIPDQNYTAHHENPRIFGIVKGMDGSGVHMVTLTFSHSDGTEEETSVYTLTDGTYGYTVKYGWSGTVTPSKSGCIFEPVRKAYSNLTISRRQDFTCLPGVILTLTASRQADSTVSIKKYVGVINFSVELEESISVDRYCIYRRTNGGPLQEMEVIPGYSLQNGDTHTYYDKYLDENTSYTYQVVAKDSNGDEIGASDEQTI